jgi:hypothetical protein
LNYKQKLEVSKLLEPRTMGLKLNLKQMKVAESVPQTETAAATTAIAMPKSPAKQPTMLPPQSQAKCSSESKPASKSLTAPKPEEPSTPFMQFVIRSNAQCVDLLF